MSQDYETKVTLTCDRCGLETAFVTEKEAEAFLKWKRLSTGTLGFPVNSKFFDLCPGCFDLFETEFIKWFPSAFRNAFEEK